LTQKFVHSIKEIEKVNIETKFKFLEEHKLGSLVRKQDQYIRNKIAHNNFTINDDVDLLITEKMIAISKRLNEILDFIGQITTFLHPVV